MFSRGIREDEFASGSYLRTPTYGPVERSGLKGELDNNRGSHFRSREGRGRV
uniref:Uncharacterized protein n=1 Tax=Physcomitrium patens TaxID=3218 RepID=A0A2K1JYS5_PHYPA|nr:hypothetical protein PHYPA_013804 [Physcomitrium patens]